MKRNQFKVKALTPAGKFAAVDIFDLTEESFRSFVLDRMRETGIINTVSSSFVHGVDVMYKTDNEKYDNDG